MGRTSEIFNYEINLINNYIIKEIVKITLDNAPECISKIPASSSGKYHPEADLGEGGLNRHVKATVGVAKSLIECDIFRQFIFGFEDYYDEKNVYILNDIVYASLILHDCYKPDNTPKHSTRFDHPLLASKLFFKTAEKHFEDLNDKESNEFKNAKKMVKVICECIESHMGQWNTAVYAKGIKLPKPNTNLKLFVHMCDYIASRKYIDFNFDKYYGVKNNV